MVRMSEPPLQGSYDQSASGSFIAQAEGGSTAIVAVFQAAAPRPIDPAELAAANAWLDALPLEELPEPKGLPSGSVMPWPQNRSFVGRETDLRTLARRLKQGGTAAVGQNPAVTGMGGQGKTQLAVELAYRYGRWFKGGVFWVNCAERASVSESVAACGTALFVADAGFSGRPLPERVAAVASALANDLPRLLIFDNCEDEAILDDWAPKGGGCRLLLTARRLSWSPARGIDPVPLGKFSRSESLALLRRHRRDLAADNPALDAIAEELGDLPLALELAGSFLGRYRDEFFGTPSAYLAELRSENVLAHASLTITDPEAPEHSRLPTGHERDVARTFAVSFGRLRPENAVDSLAREVFARAAWLAPGVPIPRHLLKLCAGIAADDAKAGRAFADALGRLLDLALVERAGAEGGIVLHRLLAAFGRSRLEQAAAARHAAELALGREANRLLPHNDPSPFRTWGAHLTAVALAAGRDGTKAAANLLNVAGYYSKLVADFEASQAMLEQAASRAEVVFGPDHPELARCLGNLGNVRYARGDLAAAQDSQAKALAIKETAYGPDHPEVAGILNNLGNVQGERGDLAAAQASLTRALAINEKAYGPDHPQVARTLGNLSLVQRDLGRIAEARDLHTRAAAIFAAKLGGQHPDTLKASRFLADLDGAAESGEERG
jgi:tetratricopeptide (TPR) repeat protein